MKITPLEIRQMTFQKSFRGYPPFEVDAFLESLADEVEEILHENVALKEKMEEQNEKILELKKTEGALTDTLLTAQKAIDGIRGAAQKEGEFVVRQAELHAEEVTGEALKHVTHLQGELINIQRQKGFLIENVRALIHSLERTLSWENEKQEETVREEEPKSNLRNL
ncbi:MAG: DivIVA domain-containing protein [Nitrospira sp.]|nr:DivIVA domain-containing protein [Candidatus Manganitrophaceae bacterium]HIL33797.1 DivIVA domain-containing protein [Candidatus Manganitrophaceae bacterium]